MAESPKLSQPHIVKPASPAEKAQCKRELLSPYRQGLPTVFHRVARRGVNWDLPRNFRDYRASSEHEMSLQGAATKCFLSVDKRRSKAYIAKFAHKNGEIETFTELFNNQLGLLLGFDMAHSGIVTLDKVLHFVSRSFLNDDETLIHGSLMLKGLGLANDEEIESIKTAAQQQGIYDVDFVEHMIREFCGDDFKEVFEKFVSMLVFDALIGSMDRHPRNWGVVRPMKEPIKFRFSPIYDSARALLWDLNDARIKSLLVGNGELKRYIDRSSPRIGLPSAKHKCNHFELLAHLAGNHKPIVINSLRRLPSSTLGLTSDLLHRWPFSTVFSVTRQRAILTIINLRLERLLSIA